MAEINIGAPNRNGNSTRMPLLGGFLIAGSCFVLMFMAMAYLIPLFLRYDDFPRSKLLLPISLLFISIGGLKRYLKQRNERQQVRIGKRP